ncbi:MAG: hypothetical protein IJ019_02500 [Alphaproteobacteria bacterium]|nr:hypothetical protein [Alphaproteobacteria bacterium]
MFSKIIKISMLFLYALTGFSISVNAGYLSPQNFNALYAMAAKGNVTAINNAKARGLDIDSTNANGDTGLCVAARKRDKKAYKSFLQSGANPSHYCTWDIVGYREFIQSVINTPTKNIDTAIQTAKTKEGMSWKTKTLIGTGVVAAGAGVGLALGGGGGSDYDPNCVHGSYKNDICVCSKGYAGKKCNTCADGYDNYGTSKCYLPLACENGEQKGGKCVCNVGYTGTLCELCADGYGREASGECIRKSGQKVVGNTMNTNYNPSSIYIINDKYTDVYGMFYDAAQTPHSHILEQDKFANAYSNVKNVKVKESVEGEDGEVTEEEVDYFVVNKQSVMEIHNNDNDSNVYGLYSNNAQTIYNTYLQLNGSGIVVKDISSKSSGIHNATIYIDSSGDGDIYGIYGKNTIYSGDFMEEGATDGSAKMSSTILISSYGARNAYGIYNPSVDGVIYNLAKVGNFITLNSTIGVNIDGYGNAYGIYGLGEIENSGIIHAYSRGGNAYGIYTKGGAVTNVKNINENTITVSIYASSIGGNAYGVYLDGGSLTNGRIINVDVESINGIAYGIYNNGGNVINSSGINVFGGGGAYGIYNKGGTVENTTQRYEINVQSETGKAYGIYSDGGTVINSGHIVVKSKDDASGFGIFATNGAKVVNKGEFVFNINNGVLDSTMDTSKYCSQNGGCLTTVDGVYAIYLENGAKLVNESSISSVSSLNLGLNGVQLGNGGQFEAKSLAGNLEVSSSVVQTGFENQYTVSDAIKSDDVSNLKLSSESALFEANLQNSDVVMVKKDLPMWLKILSLQAFWKTIILYKTMNNCLVNLKQKLM